MKTLKLNKTKLTPEVVCDAESGLISMEGRSLPENAREVYQPFFHWIDEYIKNAQDTTVLSIHMEYVNSSSNRYIHTALKKFEALVDQGMEVIVKWHYDEGDEDTLDLGIDYKEFLNLEFELIEK